MERLYGTLKRTLSCLVAVGVLLTSMVLPAGAVGTALDAYSMIPGKKASTVENCVSHPEGQFDYAVTDIRRNATITYDAIDFGTGMDDGYVTVSYGSESGEGSINLLLGSTTGEALIDPIKVESTGQWNNIRTVTAKLKQQLTGEQKICVTFTHDNDNFLCNFIGLRFMKNKTGETFTNPYAGVAVNQPAAISNSGQVDGNIVNYTGNNTELAYGPFDFGETGASSITINIGSPDDAGGDVEVYLDTASGDPAATITAPATGDWNTRVDASANFSTPVTGEHTVILKIKPTGTNDFAFNLFSLGFSEATSGPATGLDAYSLINGSQCDTYGGGAGPQDDWVNNIHNGAYVIYNAINFGSDMTEGYVALTAGTPTAGGNIEVRLDGPSGELVGTGTIPTTGGWNTPYTAMVKLSKQLSGEQKICLNFTGTGEDYLFNFMNFKFLKAVGNPYQRIDAKTFASVSGAAKIEGDCVAWIANNDILTYGPYDFGTGAEKTSVTLSAGAPEAGGGHVEVYLDEVSGTPVAEMDIVKSNDYGTPADTKVDFTAPVEGVHTVLFKVIKEDQTFNLYSIAFERSGQVVPSKDAYANIKAVDCDEISGGMNKHSDGWYLENITNGCYALYNRVDFGDGMTDGYVALSAGTESAGGNIEVRLDGPDGELLATGTVTKTTNWSTPETQIVKLSKQLSGIQKLCVKFTGGDGALMNFMRMKFIKGTTNAYEKFSANTVAALNGNNMLTVSGDHIEWIANNDTMVFGPIDFGEGGAGMTLTLSAGAPTGGGGKVEVYADKLSGTPIGSGEIVVSGDYSQKADTVINLSNPLTGIHTVILKVLKEDQTFNLYDLQFTATGEAIVDKTALTELYQAVRYLREGDYTEATWGPFKTALDTAKTVLDNEDADKTAVDNALAELQAKKDALAFIHPGMIIVEAENGGSNTGVKSYDGDVEGEPGGITCTYTLGDESVKGHATHSNGVDLEPGTYQAIIEMKILARPADEKARIANFDLFYVSGGEKFPLEAAIDSSMFPDLDQYVQLKFDFTLTEKATNVQSRLYFDNVVSWKIDRYVFVPGDPTQSAKVMLKAVIDACDLLVEDHYTKATWAPFAEALAAAKTAYEKTDAVQEDYDAARTALETKKDLLERKPEPADLSGLQTAVNACATLKEADYMPYGWSRLQDALDTAKALLAEQDLSIARQGEVDSATEAVDTARSALVLKPGADEPVEPTEPDTDALKALVKQYESVNAAHYSDETYAVFAAYYAAAQAVLTDENALQVEIDAAKTLLEQAYKALETKPVDPPVVYKPGWKRVGDDWYLLNESGKLLNGWQNVDGNWYYMSPKNGKMLTGWQKVNKKWYYLGENGVMRSGWQQVGSKWYLLAGSGAMKTGWQKVGSKWYLFASSGEMKTGWQKLGGKWYYLNNSGAMATGWAKVGAKWYLFASFGEMKTGWQQVGGKWYYLNASGAMQTGWKKLSGKWYWFDGSGRMLSGTSRKIGSKTYRFAGNGSCLNP